jgi:hypothetical protein
LLEVEVSWHAGGSGNPRQEPWQMPLALAFEITSREGTKITSTASNKTGGWRMKSIYGE